MSSTGIYVFTKPRRPVKRVFIHCSASDRPEHDNVATMDQWHKQRGWAGVGYHLFIRKNGVIEKGRDLEKVPAAQEGNNTGTIAICLHGLAVDKFTDAQFRSLLTLCHQINEAYGGGVTFHGHREVANKACPVFDYKAVLSLDRAGRIARSKVLAGSTTLQSPVLPADTPLEVLTPPVISTLRFGSHNSAVLELQRALTGLGYFPGAVDGQFGERTRSAVLAFQADNHLETDGVFGSASREALKDAKPRPVSEKRAAATVASLAGSGSRIAQAALGNSTVGGLFAAGGALSVVEQTSGIVSQLTGYAGVFGDALTRLGPWIGGAILVGGAIIVWQSVRAGKARADDYRSGKTA
ncbi:peptidoglycan recognition protein family protein [Shinella sp.]|jgi:hypothetical protein|uniref:peptidoglycan recognition protein family protein n=1 Tax=Shinella sp. TaxID=1870904 RepID=UPI003F6E6C9E